MKVLHVIHGLSVRRGGESRACAELCESLARLGLDVSLVYVLETGFEEFRPENVSLHPCGRSAGTLGSRLAFSGQVRTVLKQLVPKSDLVHIHGVWRYPGFAAAREARRCSIPYLVQPHGSLHPWKLAHKRIRKWVYGTLFERSVLRHARAIHAESEEDKRHILRYLPGAHVFVVPSGAYPARLNAPTGLATAAERWPALCGYRIILYLGRLDVNKGVDLLLRAFHAAGAARAGWRLLLVGPDFAGTRAQMEKLARQLGINEELVWAGMVSEEEKRLALQSCDFYVLPSLSENFGIAVLEAMCCGRPVITTTATPWTKLEEVGAGLRIPPTVDSLTAALRQWMALPKARLEEMGRLGYRLAAGEYDWEVVATRLKDVYAQILDSSPKLRSPSLPRL